MVETQNAEKSSRVARHSFRLGYTLARVVAAGGIVIGVLAVAGPSWAGPLMGC